MRLDEIEDLIINSVEDNWNVISLEPYALRGYHYVVSDETSHDDEGFKYFIKSHDLLGVYKPNVSLTVEVGMNDDHSDTDEGLYSFGWAKNFAGEKDKKHSQYLIDIFWNGNLVERKRYALMEDLHYVIPLTQNFINGEYPISRREIEIYKGLHTLLITSPENIDEGIKRSQISIQS